MKKYGIGMASIFYGTGYGNGFPDVATAIIEMNNDGSATILTGAADCGQGSNTIRAQIAAAELGITIGKINIISADTIVVCDNEVMGKPANEEDAIRMLKQLSGKKHEVITGVCLLSTEKELRFHTKTIVEFFDYDDEFVKAYVASKVPLDKAGAYGIQDKGALLIKGIEGDYYTVMGLPIGELYQALKKFHEVD